MLKDCIERTESTSRNLAEVREEKNKAAPLLAGARERLKRAAWKAEKVQRSTGLYGELMKQKESGAIGGIEVFLKIILFSF